MISVLRFMAEDEVPIRGRGILRTFDAGQIPDGMWDPVALVGQTVRIDGVERVVTGVDTFCIGRDEQHPYHLAFGLLSDA